MSNGDVDDVRQLATPLESPADLDALLDAVGDARIVLLGEASHGTSQYYDWRAAITRRLIEEKGFDFVAVEGDWPDCFRINQWVKSRRESDVPARNVLQQFQRWPTWMWANEEVADFIDWLRDHNRSTTAGVGFYGLDVYSLWDSMRVVLDYLGDEMPDEVEHARGAWRCFEPYDEDPQRYAWATRMAPTSCEDAVVELLIEVRRQSPSFDGDPEAALDALQNAEVLRGAEHYYRTMARADGASWNVRDHHMVDTLDRLLQHHGAGSRAVVWEHNTHVGDARATDMADAGMVNVGQLARERHPGDVFIVGFAGHRGSVIAADEWGMPMRRMEVPEARPDSHEHLIHKAIGVDSLFVFPDDRGGPWLRSRRGHRAIGVVYRPSADRYANWVPTVMGRRYDALCYFEMTDAVHPLHLEPAQPAGEQRTAPWTT